MEIRAYVHDDRRGCLDLLCRGHDPRFTAERFAWLHDRGPAGPSRKVVCEQRGRIVGLYAVLPRAGLLDGKPITAGRDVDPVVDPDCRGQGLFTRMLDWMLEHTEGIGLFYNFANRASAPGFARRGWRSVDVLSDHVAQLGCRQPFGREGLLWAASRLLRPRTDDLPVRVLTADEVRALPSPLTVPGRRFAVPRTAAYLDWRYLQSPLHEYRILARYDGDAIVDALVVKAAAPTRRIVLLDVVAYRADGGACAAYLPFLRKQFGDCWVGLWSTVPSEWRRGFLKSPWAKGLPLLARRHPSVESAGIDLQPGDCFVTHGDVEAN